MINLYLGNTPMELARPIMPVGRKTKMEKKR